MDAVEEARALLDRLERIDALKSASAPAGVLLKEVWLLLVEAEAWAETDQPGERAESAIRACREALAERAAVR